MTSGDICPAWPGIATAPPVAPIGVLGGMPRTHATVGPERDDLGTSRFAPLVSSVILLSSIPTSLVSPSSRPTARIRCEPSTDTIARLRPASLIGPRYVHS